jgi:hypothetical protein
LQTVGTSVFWLLLSVRHPPVPVVHRTYVNIVDKPCNCYWLTAFRTRKDVALPLFTPITGVDGRVMHEIIVPKDTTIMISIINSNRDPALWGTDSYEWRPERWLSPLPGTIVEAPVPGVYSHL